MFLALILFVQYDLDRMLEAVNVIQDSLNSIRSQIHAEMDKIANQPGANTGAQPQRPVFVSAVPDTTPDVCIFNRVFTPR